MPLSLLVFSSSLSNALCFCLFIQQRITRMNGNISTWDCISLRAQFFFSFFAIASELHLWFYHCRHKFKSFERMPVWLAYSFTQLNSHDLWEPFSIHVISFFSRWNLNVYIFKSNKSMFCTDFWTENAWSKSQWMCMVYDVSCMCVQRKIDQDNQNCMLLFQNFCDWI